MQLPEHCRALIVEPEPMQAFALDCLLAELGCRRMGPVGSLRDLEEAVSPSDGQASQRIKPT